MSTWSNASNTFLSTNASYSYENCNTIFHICDKKIITNKELFIIRSEHNSDVIIFEMNRYFNGIDLSDKKIEVWYRSGKKLRFIDLPTNYLIVDKFVTINPQISNDDTLRFMWLLENHSTAFNGELEFCVRISNLNNTYIYATEMQEIYVKNTIDPNASIQEPNNWQNEYNTAVNNMNSATNTFNSNAYINFEIDDNGHLIITSPLIR